MLGDALRALAADLDAGRWWCTLREGWTPAQRDEYERIRARRWKGNREAAQQMHAWFSWSAAQPLSEPLGLIEIPDVSEFECER